MVSPLVFSQLALSVRVWLCLMLHWRWPSAPATAGAPLERPPLLPKRTRERKPFAGLTTDPQEGKCDETP
jgi:hypothetical protein